MRAGWALPLLLIVALPTYAADIAAGEKIYDRKCSACHALDTNRTGPLLRGAYGRKAGMAVGYSYTSAVKALGVTWDDMTLNKWLANPSAMAKGTRMSFRLNEAQDRADVIAYLKSLEAR